MLTAPKGRLAKASYTPPVDTHEISLGEALDFCARARPRNLELGLGGPDQEGESEERKRGITLYYSGNLSLLKSRCVSVVGTRDLTDDGVRRARKLAAMLVSRDVTVVSGLALGVDTQAHTAALSNGGRTIAVVGTPLDRCNPPRNAELQKKIYEDFLLISQFPWGSTVYPTNFPKRNRTMAALSDATVIVEASDSSGTLHQAVECVKLERPLFILRSVVEDKTLTWPSKFLHHQTVHVLDEFDSLMNIVFPGA
jgi:DNA processing protein